MTRPTLAALVGAALLSGFALPAAAVDLEKAPLVRAEPLTPRLSRAPQVQCAPTRPAEGFARGFEGEIDRGFGSATPRAGERRA